LRHESLRRYFDMPGLNKSKRAAVDAVARHFSADCRIGVGPPDAYLAVSGRHIALDVAVIANPRRANLLPAPRLREDRVALRVLRVLDSALHSQVPNRKCLILTLGAPIRVPRRLTAALANLLPRYIQSGRKEREEIKTVLGNRIRFRVLNRKLRWNAKVIGFVFSGDPLPGDLVNAMRELHGKISAMAKRRLSKSFRGDRWLVLTSNGWVADIKTYRRMYSQLSVRSRFKKILMVFDHGRVETLIES
jgi:hypothetical protein